MDYLQNHCWCSESNWDKANYDCRHIVSLNSYEDGYKEDWKNLIDQKAEHFFDENEYEIFKKHADDNGRQLSKDRFIKPAKSLNRDALDWLASNVQDRTGYDCNKGWCIGSTRYRGTDSCCSLSVFFHRKRDAMNFIKTFSKWKKPINYCQYFSDVRKKLDLDTLKYKSYKNLVKSL